MMTKNWNLSVNSFTDCFFTPVYDLDIPGFDIVGDTEMYYWEALELCAKDSNCLSAMCLFQRKERKIKLNMRNHTFLKHCFK